MDNKRKELLKIVSDVKDALIRDWEQKSFFTDNNNMQNEGILADSIGVTSLLLLIVTFKDEKEVFSEESITKINQIIASSINKIWDSVKANGYQATPLLSSKSSNKIFTKDDGYTDTITWILSICILARYTKKEGILSFDSLTQEKILDATADSLGKLLDNQQEEGTWGFMADKGAKKSLFFTYSVGTAIADVYDYIYGELYDNPEDHIDIEFAELLSKKMKVSDVKKRLDAARTNLNNWLIKSCLPLLPKISSCENLSAEDLDILGIWDQKMKEKSYGRNYYMLYYVYYLIDLMITNTADLQYSLMINNPSQFEMIKEQYENNKDFTKEEFLYFFSKGHDKELFTNYIEQAIHASRNNFINASRTGNDFWDTSDSELNIDWRHSDIKISDSIKEIPKKEMIRVTEPALVPMALRVNVNYCYYLSKRTDITVDNLFNIVLSDRNVEEIDDCLEGLWDNLIYNLPITERSIEAIVDYYDYLCKFVPVDNHKEKIEKTELEQAVENIVVKYLQTEDARNLLSGMEKSGKYKVDEKETLPSISKILNEILQNVKAMNDGFEVWPKSIEKHSDSGLIIADQLGQLYDQLHEYSLRNAIGTNLLTNIEDTEGINERADNIYNTHNRAFKLLMERIFNDIDNHGKIDFIQMYSDIMHPTKR